jgi:hypothetical protein
MEIKPGIFSGKVIIIAGGKITTHLHLHPFSFLFIYYCLTKIYGRVKGATFAIYAEWSFALKRILLLLCAILLLADLADDGFIGKAPILTPPLTRHISLTSADAIHGTVTGQVWLLYTKLLGDMPLWQNQFALVGNYNPPTSIHCFLCSSSGGLPL